MAEKHKFPITFRGYDKDQVDAYLADYSRFSEQYEVELRSLKAELGATSEELDELREELDQCQKQLEAKSEQLEALLGTSETAAGKLESLQKELAAARSDLRDVQEENSRGGVQLNALQERVRELTAERDSYRMLAEKFAAEEGHMTEALKAASRAAEEIRHNAQRESDALIREAEERAQRTEEDIRGRTEQLEREYEKLRADFDRFLNTTRDVAHGFVRQVDEARSKRSVL